MPFTRKTFVPLLAIALLACCMAGRPAAAQQPEVRMQAFGFEDGLSHRNTIKVQQDTNGFLWIATVKGLNRYDSHHFLTPLSSAETRALPSGSIPEMCIDAANRLWLSSGNNLLRFDIERNELDTIRPDDASASHGQERSFTNICEDKNGGVWTATFLPGTGTTWLQRTGAGGLLHDVARLPGKAAGRPLVAVNGRLYAGAFENELWVFDTQTGEQVEVFEFPAPVSEKGYSRIVQLQATANGTLWALLNNGQVWYLPPGGRHFSPHKITDFHLEHIHSSAFRVMENGDIWLTGVVTAGQSGGDSPCTSVQPGAALLHFVQRTESLNDYSYYLKQVVQFTVSPRQIFQDRTGVIWIATEFGLVHLVQNDLFVNYLADGNDCCNDGVCSMRGIAEDDQGNIYLSYYNSIHVLNPRSGSLTPLFSPVAKSIGSPFGILYHDGGLWTGSGLRIDLKTQKIDTLLRDVKGAEGVLMKDEEGDLWFGCQQKLCIIDGADNGHITEFEDTGGLMPDSIIPAITYLYQGITGGFIWVATRETGIFKITKNGGVLKHYFTKSQPALPHDRVTSLVECGGYLWAGTAGGLCRLNLANDETRTYTTADGLSNSFINGVLAEGDSAVWASTDNGLCRLDVRTGEFSSFFDTDGLSKNEFNRVSFFKAKDGRMYFGGMNGVNAFYPGPRFGSLNGKSNCKLLLSEFDWFDAEHNHRKTWELSAGNAIELSHRDKMFTAYFSLADYTDPKMHLYCYLLDGYDKGWSTPTPMNFARYFNIPAGRYTLRVKASRGGGDWVKDELSIPIRIRQAFYKTAWFRMVALGLLALLVFAIMRYRLHLARKHERELESQVQERTRELAAEKQKSEDLLLNILPAGTAEELKRNGSAKARRHEDITVMFTDFKGFSLLAGQMEPEALVQEIDHCFRAFDEIMEMYGIEKIKTVGDAYLCAGGMTSQNKEETAVQVVKAAIEIQTFLAATVLHRKEQNKPYFEARIGIHSGPVVAGIAGIKKFAYDIWGDTVNIAERLQSNGEVGKVNISKSTYGMVCDYFECTSRGMVHAKHNQEVEMFFVEGLKY
jgi:class 3 adenylate cyclase/ligand-binding sensor domain-containing protein